jgi:hypothetical protein
MELNISMKILTFCISSFQSSWHFAFCISWGTKHSLTQRRNCQHRRKRIKRSGGKGEIFTSPCAMDTMRRAWRSSNLRFPLAGWCAPGAPTRSGRTPLVPPALSGRTLPPVRSGRTSPVAPARREPGEGDEARGRASATVGMTSKPRAAAPGAPAANWGASWGEGEGKGDAQPRRREPP